MQNVTNTITFLWEKLHKATCYLRCVAIRSVFGSVSRLSDVSPDERNSKHIRKEFRLLWMFAIIKCISGRHIRFETTNVTMCKVLPQLKSTCKQHPKAITYAQRVQLGYCAAKRWPGHCRRKSRFVTFNVVPLRHIRLPVKLKPLRSFESTPQHLPVCSTELRNAWGSIHTQSVVGHGRSGEEGRRGSRGTCKYEPRSMGSTAVDVYTTIQGCLSHLRFGWHPLSCPRRRCK